MTKKILFIFLLISLPFFGHSQLVISGTGLITAAGTADMVLTGDNWTNNASGAGYTASGVSTSIIFKGTSAQTINGSKATTFDILILDNSAGLTLSIDATITDLTFQNNKGIITTGANTISIPVGGAINGASTVGFVNGTIAKTGATDFKFEVGSATKYAPIEAFSLSESDVFTANYVQAPAPDGGNIPSNIELVSGFEYWNLIRAGGSTTADVKLYWYNSMESEIGTDLSNLFIVHHNGISTWDNAALGSKTGAGDLATIQAGSVASTVPYTSFGYFTFGSDNSTLTPLPVELLYFNANINQYVIAINWATASEQNSDYFNIEKSSNGVDWKSIGQTLAQGNSSSLVNYKHIDKYPFLGNQYYRLKQVDFDGSVSYSDIIIVGYDNILSTNIEIYPNPSKDFTSIIGRKTELDILKIYTTMGRDVTHLVYIDRLTENRAYLNLTQLAQGQYIIKTKSSVNKILIE